MRRPCHLTLQTQYSLPRPALPCLAQPIPCHACVLRSSLHARIRCKTRLQRSSTKKVSLMQFSKSTVSIFILILVHKHTLPFHQTHTHTHTLTPLILHIQPPPPP